MADGPLKGVEALTFDVFGTVVDWHGSVTRSVKEKAARISNAKSFSDDDWSDFANEWRSGYLTTTRKVASGGEGPLNVDIMHRQILDEMLASDRWSSLGRAWTEEDRKELVLFWHKLDGWPDSSKGLYALKKKLIVATLSNGNVRLLADMARHADLPWDVIFSGELLGSYKPNPKVYQGALHHLSIQPQQCAMVAAHIYDLRAAEKQGMRTIYLRRPTEDPEKVREAVKSKAYGGEVDVVVNGLDELAKVLGIA